MLCFLACIQFISWVLKLERNSRDTQTNAQPNGEIIFPTIWTDNSGFSIWKISIERAYYFTHEPLELYRLGEQKERAHSKNSADYRGVNRVIKKRDYLNRLWIMQQPDYHNQDDLWAPFLGRGNFIFPLLRHGRLSFQMVSDQLKAEH